VAWVDTQTHRNTNFALFFSSILIKKKLRLRVPGHQALAKAHDEIIYIFMFFEHLFLKKVTFSSGRSHRHSARNMIVLLIFYHIDLKNLQMRVPGHWALTTVHFSPGTHKLT